MLVLFIIFSRWYVPSLVFIIPYGTHISIGFPPIVSCLITICAKIL